MVTRSVRWQRLLNKLKGTSGSASVEFVLLAIPLFLPILIFLNQFSNLSNSELVTRSLVREALRAYVTSEDPFSAASRAEQTLQISAKAMGLNEEEINSLDLRFICSNFPCVSPNSKVRAILKMQILNPNRTVVAEAQEQISPWQWNGIPHPVIPGVKVDL